jgi:short-subunit dehydrogenase
MGKVILITGASSGIGRSTAILLASKGHTVYGAARRMDKMQDLLSSGIKLLEMDVTIDESMVRGVNVVLKNEKRIDVLVNNAGYGSYGALEDVPMSEARYQFDVNIFGLARLTQLVLPGMRAQHSGTIINISSIGGSFGEPNGAWYHATKYAVEGLSDCLRLEVKPFGIEVVVIKPGAIKTEWTDIARNNLIKVSGNTAYKDLVQKQYKLYGKGDQMGSEPIVIARAIEKAINASTPKTRYLVGSGAKPLLFMKSLLSDRMFDRLYMTILNRS